MEELGVIGALVRLIRANGVVPVLAALNIVGICAAPLAYILGPSPRAGFGCVVAILLFLVYANERCIMLARESRSVAFGDDPKP